MDSKRITYSKILRIRRLISNFVWRRSKSSTSSSQNTRGRDSCIELKLMDTSNNICYEERDLTMISQEHKDIPARYLCPEALEIIVEHLCRFHPVTLRQITPIRKIRDCFEGNKSRIYKFEADHIKELLDNWIREPRNSIGDLIHKIKELKRMDILRDEELIKLAGK